MSDYRGGQQPGPYQPPRPQPSLPDPGQPEWPKKPPSPKKPRKWLPWAAAAGTFVLGLVIGSAGSAGSGNSATDNAAVSAPTVTVTAPAKPAATTAPPAPATTEPPKATAPTVKDFKLTVKTLTKQCFGSAGCNVTFRVLVAYSGPALDPSKEYEVLYQVRGGEDGPIANKLIVSGDESSVDEEEMVSTPKSSTKLVAVVTDVMES